MKTQDLLKKIFNIRQDYIETIHGKKSPEEDKQNLEKFISKVKTNRGKIISVSTAISSTQKYEYLERFDASRKLHHSDSGYYESYEPFTEFDYHFIIHYKSHKRIEEKDL